MKPRRAPLLTGIASAALLGSLPAFAQDQPKVTSQADPGPVNDDVDPELYNENEIVVLADRLRGQVDAPQPPLQVLDEADIAAYGASSIADLLQQLSPQTTSGRGRGSGGPALLVNGMRISSFRELRSYPPEAIRRVEILPEEVALRYGYSADQRVINIILKDNYSSFELEREYGQPTAGGYWAGQLEATYLKIAGSNRLNVNAKGNYGSPLTDLERKIIEPDSLIPTVATDPDPAAVRTLVDEVEGYGLDATYTIGVGKSGGSLAINASADHSVNRSEDGYNIVLLTDPMANTERRVVNPESIIVQKNKSYSVSGGATFNHPIGDWQLTATLDGTIANTKNYNDRLLDTSSLIAGALAGDFAIDGTLPVLPDNGRDVAETTSRTFNGLATGIGTLFYMPAGDVSATLRAGYGLTQLDTRDTRNPGIETMLRRNTIQAGGNIGIPLTSRRDDVLAAMGDISLNFSGGIDDLSDFGTLFDWTAGITWSPTERLSLQATYIYDEAAPGLSQLGNPTVVRENVAVYDFANNETVLVQSTSGGNPLLKRETRKDIRLAAQWALPFLPDGSLQFEFFRNRSNDIASGFPSILTPDIEAAFANRVTRATDGTLTALDLRPVTYAEQTSKRIRYGINLSTQIGKARERQSEGGQQPGGGAPAAPQQGNFAVGPNGPQFAGGQGGPGGFGGQGGANPAAFQALREQLCTDKDSGELPAEIAAALPEQLRARLNGEDGHLDPERVKEFKGRICNADFTLAGGAPGQGGPGGQPFDPSRFAAIRQIICAEGAEGIPDLSDLPEQMLAQIRGEDGQVDPAKYQQFKARFCSFNPGGGQQAQGGEQQQGGPPQGGFFRFGGSPGAPPGGGPGGPPGGGFRGGGGGGGPPIGAILGRAGGGGGDGRGRLFLNLFHTIELSNELLIADGLPVLDLLDGDAIAGAGTVRHSIQLEGGMFYQGKGMRFSGRYSGPSDINGTGLPGSTDLHFGALATLDLRFFIDLGQQEKLVAAHPIFKGTRFSISVNNITDSRRTVTDSNGEVPIRYQPGLIDPVGRYFEVSFRKVF